jgi:hypothetical protein
MSSHKLCPGRRNKEQLDFRLVLDHQPLPQLSEPRRNDAHIALIISRHEKVVRDTRLDVDVHVIFQANEIEELAPGSNKVVQ